MSLLMMARRGAVVSGGGFTPNLPSGLTLVGDTNWAPPVTSGTVRGDGFRTDFTTPFPNGTLLSGTDVSAPYSSDVLITAYDEGTLGGGSGGGSLGVDGTYAWEELYVAITFRVSSNYSVHTVEEKFFYPTLGAGEEATMLDFKLTGSETANGTTFGLYLNTQVGGNGTVKTQATETRRLSKTQYHHMEVYFKVNTVAATQDGVCKVWIDGELVMDHADIRFTNTTGRKFATCRFTGTRGGGDSAFAVPTGGQTRSYDRIACYAR